MSAASPDLTTRAPVDGAGERHQVAVRRSTETKASFKTTEFIAYLAMLIGIFVAGAVAKASNYGGHDVFRADRVWLYAVILTVGYMLSRGFAKAGSPDPYTTEER
jgi:hypothetical protein